MPTFPDSSHRFSSFLPHAAALAIALLAASAASAIDRPIVERALRDTPGVHADPSVAGNGSDFFSAWSDGRAHVYDDTQPSPRQEWDVYGARIRSDGTPDSTGGVPLSPSWLRDESPTVLWNGSEYVVVAGASGWGWVRYSDVIFTPVTSEGPQGRRVIELPPATYGGKISAAWNGSHYLVVMGYRWFATGSDPILRHSVVTAFVADAEYRMVTPIFEVSFPSVDSILPSVTSDGDTFLVSWVAAPTSDVAEIRTAVVTSLGGVTRTAEALDSMPRSYLFSEQWPAPAAWNGGHYLITWSTQTAIRGRLLDRRAIPVANPVTIAETPDIAVFAPSIAWNGSMFLVAFSYRNEWPTPTSHPVTNLYAARVRSDGTRIDDPYPLTISTAPGHQTRSAVAASGSRFLVVFSNNGVIESALVLPTVPQVQPPAVVTRGLAVQSNAAGASIGNQLAFLWTEQLEVMFGRTSRDGRPLDEAGIAVGSGTSRAILSNGSVLLAVWMPKQPWTPGHELRAKRITPEGLQLDTSPIELPQGGHLFASDGRDFLVLTREARTVGGYDRSRLASYTVSSNGAVSRAISLDPAAEYAQYATGVAWNGSHYLVVYGQYLGDICYRCAPAFERRGILLDRAGTPIGSPFMLPVAGPVAGADGRFLVVGTAWSAEGGALVYAVVDDSGSVVRTERIDKLKSSTILDVATNGNAFFIAAGHSLFHVSRDGELLREVKGVTSSEMLAAQLIDAAGVPPLLIRRLEKLLPGIHEGGIERYFLRFPQPGRVRAVRP